MSIATAFWTIGHSTRTTDEFVAIVRGAAIDMIVDVRTIPRSRTNPQYNQDLFPKTLAQFGIDYLHLATLGGRRGRSVDVSPDINAFWHHPSFHNYADYALSASFHEGLEQLRSLGRTHRCAIMCSEAVWWRCHRRIITDYLLAAGDDVYHLLSETHAELATLTPAATPRSDGTIVYPAEPTSS